MIFISYRILLLKLRTFYTHREDNISRIVDNHSLTLKRMVFVPKKTKGGLLVRPKYHEGNRGGRAHFPVLNFMAISSRARIPNRSRHRA